MKTRYLYLSAAIVAIAAAIILLQNPPLPQEEENLGILSSGGENTGLGINQVAPDFALKDSTGNVVKLSDFRGEGVIVNFWASWCPSCVEEMPDIQKAAKQNNVQVLFVNRGESQTVGMTYIERTLPANIEFPVLWDTREEVSKKYILFGMPVTYFIDEEGVIKDRKFGPMDFEEIQSRIQAVV